MISWGIEPLIAVYALLSTEMRSAEEAVLFATEKHNKDDAGEYQAGKMKHPFIGFVPLGQPQDLEA